MNNILFPEQINYLEDINRHDDELLTRLEKYAEEKGVPILDKISAALLEQLIVIAKPSKVLELGTAIGYSTIRAARKLQEGSKIISIEISPDSYKIARINLDKSGAGDKAELVLGDAIEYTAQCKEAFDFIFLDADKEDYEVLFNNSVKLLNMGGVMFIDNLLWHGYAAIDNVPQKYVNSAKHIKKFNEMFMAREDFNSVILPVGDGIGLGIKIA